MKNKPTYCIDSVDNALLVATLLHQDGPMRVTDVARRLGVARSTAHRLLSMLVYREFAEQDADRKYVAGPVFRRPMFGEPTADLRRIALPHLKVLTLQTRETSNLLVIGGDQVRFAATVECGQVLRVGDREGRVLPAHLASGGRAVLAALGESDVRALYSGPAFEEFDIEALLRDLRRVRRQGFAVNDQRTEAGVTAIGCTVGSPLESVAAISLAMPSVRFRRAHLAGWVRQITTTAERIATEWRSLDTDTG